MKKFCRLMVGFRVDGHIYITFHTKIIPVTISLVLEQEPFLLLYELCGKGNLDYMFKDPP